MKQDHIWNAWIKVIIGVVIALILVFLICCAYPVIGVVFLMAGSGMQLTGGQSEGAYYVERINASANANGGEDYFYLPSSVYRSERMLFRYSFGERKWENITGKDSIDAFAVEGDILYFRRDTIDGDEYWCMNLATREQRQLSEESSQYAQAQKAVKRILNGPVCEKIEDALSQIEYGYVDVSSPYLDQTGDPIIGITQEPLNPRFRGDRIKQRGLRYDILFSYDPETETCEVLYQPKNNRTRIIGYQDGEVYLFRKNKIYRENLDSGKKEELATIPESETYTFDWWKDYLLVLDHTKNELVEVVEI